MKTILTIIGARPQFIKSAPISKVIDNSSEFEEKLIHTGQHYDPKMSEIFFNQLCLSKPYKTLDINQCDHGEMTGKMLQEIEKEIKNIQPDYLLVYGDTNSTLAGSLAAAKLHVPVIHIESGLRSFNMKMPEEINRIITDNLSSYLFCPTKSSIKNLEREGFLSKKNLIIENIGDVMEDSAILFSNLMQKPKGFKHKEFILATIHRPENTDNLKNISSIISGLNKVHQKVSPVIMPLHPRTHKIIENLGLETDFITLKPQGYLEMLWLIKNSRLVVTDSGGLQKEAFFFEKLCITIRDETEWVELVDNEYNFLSTTDSKQILSLVQNKILLNFPHKKNLYGNGNSSSMFIKSMIKNG